ncbi:hypothetical protein OUZ56_010514 [Daphnia magna]|uniref:Uncharacterized protein n=1 Tax=Daphnia magna TaxID=35525 RepID=A0ABR0AIQ6_9CRUS|nr:hypothetical protein OUZ56_010514 [Daphnia magna]
MSSHQVEVQPTLAESKQTGCLWSRCPFLKNTSSKECAQVTLTGLKKTPGIAKNKPLSSPVSKISDDSESSSITIDDENYQIHEGYMNNISKKKG